MLHNVCIPNKYKEFSLDESVPTEQILGEKSAFSERSRLLYPAKKETLTCTGVVADLIPGLTRACVYSVFKGALGINWTSEKPKLTSIQF